MIIIELSLFRSNCTHRLLSLLALHIDCMMTRSCGPQLLCIPVKHLKGRPSCLSTDSFTLFSRLSPSRPPPPGPKVLRR